MEDDWSNCRVHREEIFTNIIFHSRLNGRRGRARSMSFVWEKGFRRIIGQNEKNIIRKMMFNWKTILDEIIVDVNEGFENSIPYFLVKMIYDTGQYLRDPCTNVVVIEKYWYNWIYNYQDLWSSQEKNNCMNFINNEEKCCLPSFQNRNFRQIYLNLGHFGLSR